MNEMIKNSGVYQRLTSSTQELERLFKEVDEKQSPPDIKKILLLLGLGTLSWISTYSGLLELIKANSGDIAFTYKMAIGFAVAMLMLMIVYILDQLFAPLNWLLRTVYIFGYIFLTIISVGFGFGFYWKFLESRSEATRSAESAITQVQSALQGGQTRLEQLEQTLLSLTTISQEKAKDEREKGNSCPNSRPGDGPRRRLRDQDAKNFTFAGNFVTKRSQAVANDIKALNGDLAKVASRHPSTVDPKTGTRNAFMKRLNQRLDLTITRFNAFRTDPQLQTIRNDLAERSTTTIFPNGAGGTFKCPDPQLQGALRGVVQAIDQLPVVQKPVINAVEGSEATIEAFRRLAATLKGLATLQMPPSEDELRALRKKAVRSLDQKQTGTVLKKVQPGLNERDYIPLAIAIFVDFCLLLVSINRPMDRLKSLVPVMKDARDGPISGILSSFHATHFAGMREEFSLFQHVVFDWGGHYYVAVPLASNDIQAQYLANLFVSLEGRGIVDRAMIPPNFIIRGKLKKMGSSFADHRAFRLYKFRNGAWSNIVMDAVMGAAKDVSIAAQHQQIETQDPAPLSDHSDTPLDQNQISGPDPNFASLFQANHTANQQQMSDHGPEGIPHSDPPIEMPRLFQSEHAPHNRAPMGDNNIITPAQFNRQAVPPHRQQPRNGQPHPHPKRIKTNEVSEGALKPITPTPWHPLKQEEVTEIPSRPIEDQPRPKDTASQQLHSDQNRKVEAQPEDEGQDVMNAPIVTKTQATNLKTPQTKTREHPEKTPQLTLEDFKQLKNQNTEKTPDPALRQTPDQKSVPDASKQMPLGKPITTVKKETANPERPSTNAKAPHGHAKKPASGTIKSLTPDPTQKPKETAKNTPEGEKQTPISQTKAPTQKTAPLKDQPSDIAVNKITQWYAGDPQDPNAANKQQNSSTRETEKS